jgi:hypothetical protein
VHIDDESLVTNELVGYIHRAHTSLRLPSLGHAAARTRNRCFNSRIDIADLQRRHRDP